MLICSWVKSCFCHSLRRYFDRLEDALIEGEEIDRQTLETFLPSAEVSGKTVLIYRDGHFCGKEIKHLRELLKYRVEA